MVDFKHNLSQAVNQLTRDMQKLARRQFRSLDRIIQEQANLLMDDIKIGWPVDTGASRAAWQGPIRNEFAGYSLRNQIVYAAVIEFGGYRGVGPKTSEVGAFLLPGGIFVDGGIFSIQRPPAPVRQALSKRELALKRALGG